MRDVRAVAARYPGTSGVKFIPLGLSGAFIVRSAPISDERGHFARTYCAREFAAHGLATTFVQASVSFNAVRGTLRGLHFQCPPHAETKLVRCSRGALFDVIVDLRAASPTRGQWLGRELSAANGDALYIPTGFAHGFQTLDDDTEVHYQMSGFHVPGSARTLSYRHASLAIDWPLPVVRVSAGDAAAEPDGAPEWI